MENGGRPKSFVNVKHGSAELVQPQKGKTSTTTMGSTLVIDQADLLQYGGRQQRITTFAYS